MFAELRYAFRQLKRSPGFTLTAMLTLALGIGTSTAVFSLLHAVLLRELPFAEPDRVAVMPMGLCGAGICVLPDTGAASLFHSKENTVPAFASVAEYAELSANFRADGAGAERLKIADTTSGFADVLGVQPVLGRSFLKDEDFPGKDAVAMLGYDLWQRRFHGDPGVLGRTIRLNEQAYTVIGVMPRSMDFPAQAEVWVPTALDADRATTEAGAFFEPAVVRLRPGISVAQARAQLATLAKSSGVQDAEQSHVESLVPIAAQLTKSVRPALMALTVAVALVLLIACANTAGLLLARSSAKQSQLAMQAALGAGQGRLLRQQLMEPLLLSVAGGLCGVWMAEGLLRLLFALRDASLAAFPEPVLSIPVLLLALGLSLTSGLLAGLLPAWLSSRQDLVEGLKGTSHGLTRSRWSLHRLLVGGEVALAVVLLAGVGLLVRSMEKLAEVPLGFSTERLLTFEVNLHGDRYADKKTGGQAMLRYQSDVIDGLRGLPGAESVAAVNDAPLSRSTEMILPLTNTAGVRVGAMPRMATAEYFSTMNIPLLAGRSISAEDTATSSPVMVVTQDLAAKLWPGQSAVGRQLKCDYGCGKGSATVIGVVASQRYAGARYDGFPVYYVPYAENPTGRMTFVIRTKDDPRTLMNLVRGVAAKADAGSPIYAVETMRMLEEDGESLIRLELAGLSVFGLLAVLLAAIGIFGTTSYMVQRRIREIGLRMALGASRAVVLRAVLREGIVLVLAGAIPGIAGALLLGRLLKAAVFGVPVHDPVTLAATTALFLLVGTIGALLPARRAAQVEPMDALRQE